MKTALGLEQLENRSVLSAWSVTVQDTKNLVSTQVEKQMASAAHSVMWDLYRHLEWRGTLDLLIDVQPNNPDYDGTASAVPQVMPDGRNATVYEMRTGIDPMPNDPDLGMSVFLGRDGTVKLYGMKAYFDPAPAPYVAATVPAGYFDFIGVLNHEVAHGLGFQMGTTDFSRYVTTDSKGFRYFNGPETVKVLGQPLPMSTTPSDTHYGNYLLPGGGPIHSGLMFEGGVYGGNRLDWAQLDFAVLKDVGLSPKLLDGLPLTDRMDWSMPKLVAGGSTIGEKMPAGTFVTNLGTDLGSNYTFRICPVRDCASFRIQGTTLVTTQSFEYKTRNLYQIYVRIVDKDGVWTDSLLNIRINPFVPRFVSSTSVAAATMQGPATSATAPLSVLPPVRIAGNSNTRITAVLKSATGLLWYGGSDRSIQVTSVKNSRGGTTLTLVGTAGTLNKGFASVFYRGFESQVTIQIGTNGKICDSAILRLRRV